MKTSNYYQIRHINLSFLLTFLVAFTQPEHSNSPAVDIFVGSSPCDQSMRPFLSIPGEHPCEFVKWKLALFENTDQQLPRFVLEYTYGMSQAGTQGFVNGGTDVKIIGRYNLARSTGTLPGESVIKLQQDAPNLPISFAKLNKNILHMLDNEGQLMIGNAGWSYTLSKKQ
jgi:hypothetical protein